MFLSACCEHVYANGGELFLTMTPDREGTPMPIMWEARTRTGCDYEERNPCSFKESNSDLQSFCLGFYIPRPLNLLRWTVLKLPVFISRLYNVAERRSFHISCWTRVKVPTHRQTDEESGRASFHFTVLLQPQVSDNLNWGSD